jgi:hypothetical protein
MSAVSRPQARSRLRTRTLLDLPAMTSKTPTAFVIAKLIEVVLRYALTRVRFDKLMEKTGIDKALQRIGLRQELNVFLPRLAYFLVLFILAKTAADALGLIAISSAIGAFNVSQSSSVSG